MGIHKEVFDLAAKMGALEGWLYERPDASSRYFPAWLDNIERMHAALPREAQTDFQVHYRELLSKISEHMEKTFGAEAEHTQRVKRMLAEAGGPPD